MNRKNLLKDFKHPKKVIFKKEELNVNYGKFIASPFERGLGITISNSLRRTLLSSLSGYAITAIRIEYKNKDGDNTLLSNEYESIYGVFEDTIMVIQNLKQIRIKLLDNLENRTIFFEKHGSGPLKANELMIDSNIQVLNPDLEIANLNEDASLFMEFQISLGRGYISAERNIDYIQTIGTIPIDAIFSPIKKVKIQNENMRIGEKSDYDKFILELWTDGTISPDDAISTAAKILKEHYSAFIEFEENEEEIQNEENENHKIETFLNTPIDSLELSVRSSNCLHVSHIKVVRDLIFKNEDEISKIKNLGKKSIKEIEEKLEDLASNFNLSIDQLKKH